MKMQNKHTALLTLLSCMTLLAATSCKTSRPLASEETARAKEAEEFFLSADRQALQYNTLTARMHVEIKFPGKELSSRVDMKMIKDSVVQLSVVPLLGVEIFRIELGADSVKVVDRMNKYYVAESYVQLKESLPAGFVIDFNFYNLQALLTNHIFVPGEREINPRQYKRFALKHDDSVTEAQIHDAMQLLYAFRADKEEKLLSTNVTDPSKRYALQWKYADFRQTDARQTFPMQMQVKAIDNDKATTAGEIKLSFSRLQRNVPVEISFPIPEKYKRITFAEIIKKI